jgi:hypothetical protein
MRSKAKFLILMALCTIPVLRANAQDTVKFKPSGKPIILVFANIHNTFSDGSNTTSFEINRGFLGYDYSFSKTFSARVIYEATAQTVPTGVMMMGYLRNIYLQYDNGKLLFRGGIITPEQMIIWEKLWNYRFITRPFIEEAGMTMSSDLGITVKYKAADILTFDFSATNGRGITSLASDSSFRYDAGITFQPVKKVLFRAYTDIEHNNKNSQWTMSLSGVWLGEKFTAGGEYYYQRNHFNIYGHDYTGYSVFTSVRLKEKVSFFVCYNDLFSEVPNGETDPWNTLKDGSRVALGVDFKPVKGVRLAPNFKYMMPDASGSKGIGMIGFNIEARL